MSFEEQLRRGKGEPMRCPACSARLIEVERSEVTIDVCPECRGVWLDRGELDKILVRERQLAAADPDEDFFREPKGAGGATLSPPGTPASAAAVACLRSSSTSSAVGPRET